MALYGNIFMLWSTWNTYCI